MAKGRLIIINGGSSVGKTSLARALRDIEPLQGISNIRVSRPGGMMSTGPTNQLLSRIAVASLLLALICDAGRADEVTVKGTVLSGTVTAVTSDGIKFDTVYGEGTLTIPYANIERLVTEKDFDIMYGEDGKSVGRLVGFDEGTLLVGEDPESATRIAVATIVAGEPEDDSELTRLEELRSRFRYWHGNFDFGFALTQSTTDTSSLTIVFKTTRQKGPSKLSFQARYLFSNERQRGQSLNTLDNELYGIVRYEYDLTDRWFVGGAIDGEYDEIERVSFRSIPRVGPGYRVYKSDRITVSAQAGPAYNYTQFFGGDVVDFFTLFFGGEADVKLPYDGKFEWSAGYFPAVTAWTDNFLFRTQASLSFPIVSVLSAKFSLYEEYNSRPAEDTVKNTLTTTMGLSVTY